MDDEDIYLEANNELETDNRKQALWIKALAVVGGDEEKAKHQYILLRVEQLKKEKNLLNRKGGHTLAVRQFIRVYILHLLLLAYYSLLIFT